MLSIVRPDGRHDRGCAVRNRVYYHHSYNNTQERDYLGSKQGEKSPPSASEGEKRAPC